MLIVGGNQSAAGYDIDNSLRFDDGSSDYLNRTYGTPTNNKIWTLSFWVKRTELGREQHILNGGGQQFYFSSGDVLAFGDTGGTQLVTSQVFRDVSAWYHIIYATDTTQATDSDRVKMYVNGTQVTSFSTSTYPTINSSSSWNTASTAYYIARYNPAPSGLYWSTYLSETYFIDGQALGPTSFGEFDEDSGVWKPIAYTGTYGTNGFYLEFKDSSALGDDTSGNTNDFTVNNLTSIDQTTDTPTNNFCTMNPLDNNYFGGTFSDGNTTVLSASSPFTYCTSTLGVSAGKWYIEAKWTSGSNLRFGIVNTPSTATNDNPGNDAGEAVYRSDGAIVLNGVEIGGYGSSFAPGDILSIALDCDNSKIYFAKNGVYQASGVPSAGTGGTVITDVTTLASGNYFFAFGDNDAGATSTVSYNFGNPPFTISSGNADGDGYGNFEYTVPSGYYSLCTKNLAEYG